MAQPEGARESEIRSSELQVLSLHEQVGQELGSEPSSKKGWNGRWLRLPGCWNIPGADVVQQLLFLGGTFWWKGRGTTERGERFEELLGQLLTWVSSLALCRASCPEEVIQGL